MLQWPAHACLCAPSQRMHARWSTSPDAPRGQCSSPPASHAGSAALEAQHSCTASIRSCPRLQPAQPPCTSLPNHTTSRPPSTGTSARQATLLRHTPRMHTPPRQLASSQPQQSVHVQTEAAAAMASHFIRRNAWLRGLALGAALRNTAHIKEDPVCMSEQATPTCEFQTGQHQGWPATGQDRRPHAVATSSPKRVLRSHCCGAH